MSLNLILIILSLFRKSEDIVSNDLGFGMKSSAVKNSYTILRFKKMAEDIK